jgi:hypothetical protein
VVSVSGGDQEGVVTARWGGIALFLLAVAAAIAQIAGPARRENVSHDGQAYTVTWWPVLCGSHQRNDCEARIGERTRVAVVLIDRGDGARVGYSRRACVSAGCGEEQPIEWLKAALREQAKAAK